MKRPPEKMMMFFIDHMTLRKMQVTPVALDRDAQLKR
jgi:hypothetical protein